MNHLSFFTPFTHFVRPNHLTYFSLFFSGNQHWKRWLICSTIIDLVDFDFRNVLIVIIERIMYRICLRLYHIYLFMVLYEGCRMIFITNWCKHEFHIYWLVIICLINTSIPHCLHKFGTILNSFGMLVPQQSKLYMCMIVTSQTKYGY